MKKIVFTLLLTPFAVTTRAQESQTEYNFLRLPVSAHAATLSGENIIIIEDDPSLMFSSPTLASSVSDRTVRLSYMNYMRGAHYMGVSYTKILGEKVTLAGGVQHMNYGKMKEVDANSVQTGIFSTSEIAAEGIFSYELICNLVDSIAAKFITSYTGSYNSMAVSVDLGLSWYEPERQWLISLVAKNPGGQIRAYEEGYGKMPIDVQVGVSKTLATLPIRVSVTLVDLTRYDYHFINHLSLETEISLSESIRANDGYNFCKVDEMTIGKNKNASVYGAEFNVGAGINLRQFKLSPAHGKHHATSNSILVNLAYSFWKALVIHNSKFIIMITTISFEL